jgi:uncharacterized membrane protein
MYMRSERPIVYHVLKVLVWGVVAILLAMVALLALGVMMPFFLRTFLESGSVSQSLREGAKSLLLGLGGLGSAIFGLIIAIVIILVLMSVGLAILESAPSQRYRASDEALKTLKIRYAKGEITKEQFLEMKRTLQAES